MKQRNLYLVQLVVGSKKKNASSYLFKKKNPCFWKINLIAEYMIG